MTDTLRNPGARLGALGWIPDGPGEFKSYHLEGLWKLEASERLPALVDLRPAMPPVYVQGELQSCVAQSVAAAIQYLQSREKLAEFIPSRLFIWWNARFVEGTQLQNAGSKLIDAIESIKSLGFCNEIEWPYVESQFDKEPPVIVFKRARANVVVDAFKIDGTNIEQLKACLSAGFPFAFGFNVFSSFIMSMIDGKVRMPDATDKNLGGHAVLAVGYDDQRQHFIVRNSWGPGNGDRGYYYFPYHYVLDPSLSHDFWTIRAVIEA